MRKAIIISIILSIVLLIVGFYWYGDILDWSLPRIKGVTYNADSFGEAFFDNVGFAVILALVPLTTVLCWKYYPISSKRNQMLSAALIVACVGGVAVIKIIMFRMQANLYLNNFYSSTQLKVVIPMKEATFVRYMIFGLIAGCVINYFLLKDRKITILNANNP